IWNDPISKADLLKRLVTSIRDDGVSMDVSSVVARLQQREEQGSTFLNEGVALPHARIDDLQDVQVALGLTRAGVLDAPTERPIEEVFMLLSPTKDATAHLKLLARVGRMLQNQEVRRALSKATSANDVLDIIHDFEQSADSRHLAAK